MSPIGNSFWLGSAILSCAEKPDVSVPVILLLVQIFLKWLFVESYSSGGGEKSGIVICEVFSDLHSTALGILLGAALLNPVGVIADGYPDGIEARTAFLFWFIAALVYFLLWVAIGKIHIWSSL